METYTFETMVAKHGIIKIPQFNKFENKKVQIVITLKEPDKLAEKKKAIKDFFEKWGGFFSTIETDDVRYNYLMEKHQIILL